MAQAHILVGSVGARDTPAHPTIRRIRPTDLKEVLIKGWEDFLAVPSHAIFLCVIYPIIGITLSCLAFGYSLLPLLYPLATGFALIGPIAAICLYELSRRREAGHDAAVLDTLGVLRTPSVGAICALGLLLTIIFLLWIAIANAIYVANFDDAPPASISQFARDVLTTSAGWNLIFFGNAIGFGFAVLVLSISAISFPLLLDRDVGAAVAVLTSVRVVLANPMAMALWGLIVAVLLFLGSLPFFLGLTVVLPVLGHSTWHLYRKVVEPDPRPRRQYRQRPPARRWAADFPAALFSSGENRP